MITRLFKRKPVSQTPQQIYGGLMTQAREPAFFARFGVPDTVMGRFDMLAMHTYLLTRRLSREEDALAGELGQDIFDLFVEDIERALRQLGIGDTTVPKRKKRLVHSFYAQIDEFDAPLESSNITELADKVAKRYLDETKDGDPAGIAEYMIKTAKLLQDTAFSDICKAHVAWIVPDES